MARFMIFSDQDPLRHRQADSVSLDGLIRNGGLSPKKAKTYGSELLNILSGSDSEEKSADLAPILPCPPPPNGKQAYAQEHHHPQGNARRPPCRPQGERAGLRQTPGSGFSPAVIEGEGSVNERLGPCAHRRPARVPAARHRKGLIEAWHRQDPGLRRAPSSSSWAIPVITHLRLHSCIALRVRCEYDGVPDETFMILVLNNDALEGISGVAFNTGPNLPHVT